MLFATYSPIGNGEYFKDIVLFEKENIDLLKQIL